MKPQITGHFFLLDYGKKGLIQQRLRTNAARSMPRHASRVFTSAASNAAFRQCKSTDIKYLVCKTGRSSKYAVELNRKGDTCVYVCVRVRTCVRACAWTSRETAHVAVSLPYIGP